MRAAEQRGLLHRDIKPGNILFNDDNLPKIVDFGLARASDQARNANEPIWGTPYYIAPEKLRGRGEDLRSDMYSLGASLYHALAGRPPFDAATASEVVTKHATQPAFSLKTYAPTIQPQTAQVIGRMLAKNPDDRYQTYEELIHAFDEALHQYREAQTSRAVVTAGGERITVSSAIGTGAALVVCALIVWFVWAYRVSIFKLEDEAPVGLPALPHTTEPAATTRPAPVVTNLYSDAPIDFQEDARWVAAWNKAMQELGKGNGQYNQAFKAFESARSLAGNERPRVRQWIRFFEGLALLEEGRRGMSVIAFDKGVKPGARPGVPPEITTGNFVDTLLAVMLGAVPLDQLEKETSRMPAWAAALSRVSIGFKYLENRQLHQAEQAFQAYATMPRDERHGWAFQLQPLARRLAQQCRRAQALIRQADELTQSGRPDEAQRRYRSSRPSFPPLIQPLLEDKETALASALDQLKARREAERRRQEKLQQEAKAREQAKAQTEVADVDALAGSLKPLLRVYDFQAARKRVEAYQPKLTTNPGRQALRLRIAEMTLLVELKQQLIRDFRRRPFPCNQLRKRSGGAPSGDLKLADENELRCETKYGFVPIPWSELPESEIIKLSNHYLRRPPGREDDAATGQRYLQQAVFYRYIVPNDQAMNSAAREALKRLPAQADLIRQLFGVK